MLFRRVQRAVLLLLLLSPAACRNRPHAPLEHSFYYWKTSSDAYYTTQDSLRQRLGLSHFYLHYMDVDWSESLRMPVPLFEERYASWYATGRYTPVVYITNRVFERASDAWCDSLALRLEHKLRRFVAETEESVARDYYEDLPDYSNSTAAIDSAKQAYQKTRGNSWTEVQIDCDWTPATKDRYFRFLRSFKALFKDKTLSVTVRLYPYKYPGKMGVPPADRGLLMCYNIDNIRNPATRNSVFDPASMRSYLGGKKYPLPLDAALPIFSWTAVFRGGAYKGLLREADSSRLNNPRVFEAAGGNRYRLLRDTVLEDFYLRAGDVLRLESPDPAALRQAAGLLAKELPDLRRLAFYHWNYKDVLRYENTIAESWRRP